MGFIEFVSQLAPAHYVALLALLVWMLGFLAAVGIVAYMAGLCCECFFPDSPAKKRATAVESGLSAVGIWAPSDSMRVILRIRPGS